ncbi:MAG: hypothetical protein NTX17_03515 [Candidatus Eisenbacteria bacterium]|nr:hypothetical protein [Candidatus Eisenbacteria bacterium]
MDSFSPGFSPSLSCGEIHKIFPDILAGRDFKKLVEAIVSARKHRRPVIFMIGGHVIKTGVSPLIIQLIEENVVTALAMTGSAAIHDVEIAMWGKTSEEVEDALQEGVFGMTAETAHFMNKAVAAGFERAEGMGRALGSALHEAKAPFIEKSLVGSCYEKGIPLTVHVAIGTDVIHQHPEASGKAIGETSMRDFRLFVSLIEHLRGGVVVNVGSAVILPEVFLKAIASVRNRGTRFWPFTAANIDMIQHYRPLRNIVERPTRIGRDSVGIKLTGHHEIMIPLLTASILHRLSGA